MDGSEHSWWKYTSGLVRATSAHSELPAPNGVPWPKKQAALPQSKSLDDVNDFTEFTTRKGAEGKEEREGSEKVREVLGRIREGQIKSFCMLGESHSSPNKWRAFPSIYAWSFHLHHQTSFQVQIFPKPVACKPAIPTIWFIPDNLPL